MAPLVLSIRLNKHCLQNYVVFAKRLLTHHYITYHLYIPMPFLLIKGTFHVRNYSPDGDSIRFKPDNPSLIGELTNGDKAKFNARGHVQLRIEAIDALETHYNPPSGGGTLHQPLGLAYQAVDNLLAFMGITDVEWDSVHRTVLEARDNVPGYILSRAVEKYGRPIAFLFMGNAPKDDGRSVHLSVDHLRESYNYDALSGGYAYPTYYTGLFSDLREALTDAVRAARADERLIHSADRTTDGVAITSLRSITEEFAILPKLFRRLSEYLVNFDTVEGFKRMLAESREPVLDLRHCHFTHFDTFVEESGNQIKLTRFPEELVFDEMPTRPVNGFSKLMDR